MARLQRLDPTRVVCCSVVRGELLFGARKSQQVDRNLIGMAKLLEPYDSFAFDDGAASYYGMIRAVLERGGTPIGGNDLMIAAISLRHDFVLVTRNHAEFSRVPGLRLEIW